MQRRRIMNSGFSPPVKIIHLIYGFRIGGAECFLLDLCRNLNPTLFLTEIIYFFKEERLLEEFRQAGITCTLSPVLGNHLSLRETLGLSRLIRSKNPDIVHTHLYHASRWGALGAYMAGVRRIVRTKHSLGELGPGLGLKERGWAILGHLFFQRVVGVSRIVAEKVHTPDVIYDGIDTNYFRRDSEQNLSVNLLEHTARSHPLIGCVGRLTEAKGHDNLLKAVFLLKKQLPEMKVLICGDGEKRQELGSLTDQLGIRDRVHFAGFLKPIKPILNHLDIFVHPSKSEGLGMALLEAMAMELPVVASRVGGVIEIVDDQIDGILVASEDPDEVASAIYSLWNDEELRRRISANARKKVLKKFSLSTMVREYERLYLEMLGV